MQKDPGGQKLALALGGALIVIAVGILFVVRSNKNTDTENTVTTPATTASGDVVELQMWDQEEADNTVIIDSWLRKFESTHPNVKITRQTYPNEDLRTKYTMAAAGAQAPELVWGPNDIAGGFWTAQIIQPVELIIDTSKFVSTALEAVTLEGKVMAVPMTYGNHLMMLYNKSMIPAAPKTTDELIEIAKKHTDVATQKYGFAFFQNEPFWMAPMLGGFGGWPLNVSGATVDITLDTPEMVETLAFIKDLKFTHKILPVECDYDCAKGLFFEEKTPMTINGDWAVREYRKKLGDKLGIAALPIVSKTNKPMTPMVSGRYLFVNANIEPQKMEMVKQLVSYLSSNEVQIAVGTQLERIPVTIEAQASSEVQAIPAVKELIETAANGRAMPAQAEMRAAWDAIRPVQQKLMAGEIEPAAGAKQMQASAVEKLASLKK